MMTRSTYSSTRTVCLLLSIAWSFALAAEAQTRHASYSDEASERAAEQKAGGAAGDDILNMDIEQLAKAPVVVPSMD
ncbi:MAG: hypothetical protein JW719_11535, partial [Pirellulales bacterium]|nr:hypothetical protein [Pirellulales bacterium]